MGKKDWPNELIELMIDMYKDRPCLWQLKHVDYLNKNVKNIAYDEIVTEVKKVIPDADRLMIKTKYQNLRTSFRKESKKVDASERSATGVEDVYEPVLWYYDRLTFVKDQDKPQPSVTYVENSPSSTQLSQMSAEDDFYEDQETDGGNEDYGEKEKETYLKPPQQRGPSNRKKFRSDPEVSRFVETCTAAVAQPPGQDERDVTGKYVALKLQQMNERQRILAECIILQVMSKGLRNQLKDSTELVDRAESNT